MKSKNLSVLAQSSQRSGLCFAAVLASGVGSGLMSARAQSVYNVTSIGQPLNLSFGDGAGQIGFTGSFAIDPAWNYSALRALQGVDSTLGVLGSDEAYGYSLSNYRLTAGNNLTTTPWEWQVKQTSALSSSSTVTWSLPMEVAWSGDSLDTTVIRTLNSAQTNNYSVTGTSSKVWVAPVSLTKTFDFTTIEGSASLAFSPLFPQGAAAQFDLEVSDSTRQQLNTSRVQIKAEPGLVAPGSFTTADTSLFRWDLTGNTTAGAGTNWTQISFAEQVATFTAGTQFVIAFDATTNFLDSFWSQNRSWDIFDGGTISGDGAAGFLSNLNFTFTGGMNRPSDIPNGYNASKFSFDQMTGTLNWTAIPEPTSALSGILLAAGLMRRRRR